MRKTVNDLYNPIEFLTEKKKTNYIFDKVARNHYIV